MLLFAALAVCGLNVLLSDYWPSQVAFYFSFFVIYEDSRANNRNQGRPNSPDMNLSESDSTNFEGRHSGSRRLSGLGLAGLKLALR